MTKRIASDNQAERDRPVLGEEGLGSISELGLKHPDNFRNHLAALDQRADDWLSGNLGHRRWEDYIEGKNALCLHFLWTFKNEGGHCWSPSDKAVFDRLILASAEIEIYVLNDRNDHSVFIGVVAGDDGAEQISGTASAIFRGKRLNVIQNDSLEFGEFLGYGIKRPSPSPSFTVSPIGYFRPKANHEIIPFRGEGEDGLTIVQPHRSRHRGNQIVERAPQGAEAIAGSEPYLQGWAQRYKQLVTALGGIKFEPYLVRLIFNGEFPGAANLVGLTQCPINFVPSFIEN